MKNLFRKDKLFVIYQVFLFIGGSFSIYFLLFRPDLGTNIIQGDLTPYFINPTVSLKESLSFRLNTGLGNIYNIVNIGSTLLSLIFLCLKIIFGNWSQQVYYYFVILMNYILVYTSVRVKHKHILTMFIVYVIFNNVFARYLLSPSLFHILLTPTLIYLLFFNKIFKNSNLYYLLLTLTSIIVSTNLTYLFIIIIVKVLHFLFEANKKNLYSLLVVVVVFIISAIPILLARNFYYSPVQSRVNQEMVMYKIQGYSAVSSLYLTDKNMFSASDRGVSYTNSLGNYAPIWTLALVVVACMVLFTILSNNAFPISVYMLFVTTTTSFRYISPTLMYSYFQSPFFALLREYKKIGFIFVIVLTVLLVNAINKKKWIPIFLLSVMCVVYINLPFGPLNNKYYYVNIPYDLKLYSRIIPTDSKILFWPLDMKNGTNSQLESTKWGFYGYNPMHYFHSSYLDTARAQLLDVQTYTWLASYAQCEYSWSEPYFDFILYRKDLTHQTCDGTLLPYVIVYEDEYVKIFKLK